MGCRVAAVARDSDVPQGRLCHLGSAACRTNGRSREAARQRLSVDDRPQRAECANLKTPRARAVTRGGRSTRRALSCLRRILSLAKFSRGRIKREACPSVLERVVCHATDLSTYFGNRANAVPANPFTFPELPTTSIGSRVC